MSEQLGYENNAKEGYNTGNSRNGTTPKKLHGDFGEVEIQVPRDRNGEYEPQLLPKHQKRVNGFDEKIITLYARGMSTRDIKCQVKDLYDVDVSPGLISNITDAVLEDVKTWQNRSLDSV